ncbi:hypothetical protein GALL_353600 [mine drainage metagenome]|uniref:Uncharacterized protein n=1 Tax=mine drainage metagenome TaxID=410659 RepID=A0A1J5QSL3_9ZZZZ
MPRGQLEQRARGVDALGNVAELGDDVGQRLAGGQLQPDAPVARQLAGAGQHQIAQSAQAGEGLALRAQRQAEPGHFGEPAGDQRGARVVTLLEAVADAASDRQHVLHRAADGHADLIVAGVDAHAVAVQRVHAGAQQRGVAAGRGQRRRQSARDLVGETRARQQRHWRTLRPAGENLFQHLMRQRRAAALEALGQHQHAGCASAARAQLLRQLAQGGQRHRQHQQSVGRRMVQRDVELGAAAQLLGQRHAGQVAAVLATALDLQRLRGVARPQHCVGMPGGMHGQRRTPGAGAEHRDLHHRGTSRSKRVNSAPRRRGRSGRHAPARPAARAGSRTSPGN